MMCTLRFPGGAPTDFSPGSWNVLNKLFNTYLFIYYLIIPIKMGTTTAGDSRSSKEAHVIRSKHKTSKNCF